jgi:hypothetical protein
MDQQNWRHLYVDQQSRRQFRVDLQDCRQLYVVRKFRSVFVRFVTCVLECGREDHHVYSSRSPFAHHGAGAKGQVSPSDHKDNDMPKKKKSTPALGRLVSYANKMQSQFTGEPKADFAIVRDAIRSTEVVFAIWPDPSEPEGIIPPRLTSDLWNPGIGA